VFFPFDWSEWDMALTPGLHRSFSHITHAVHLWNSMWALNGADKNGSYPPDSLYEMLKMRFGITTMPTPGRP
jgi:hypothetical protein